MIQRRLEKVSKFRLFVVCLGLLVCFQILFGRLLFLTSIDTNKAQISPNYQQTKVVKSKRGDIYDRNGKLLATSLKRDTIQINRNFLLGTHEQVQERLLGLATVFGWSLQEINKKIRQDLPWRSRFIARKVPASITRAINDLDLPGIEWLTEYRRYYPEGEVIASTLGITGIDSQGLEGIELAYEDHLKGKDGILEESRNGKGNVVKREIVRTKNNGNPLYLTIDYELQAKSYTYLREQGLRTRAEKGLAVIIDINNRDILALANWPSYNPNSPNREVKKNYAMLDYFEPGSVMKPFTVAVALENNVVDTDSQFDVSEKYFQVGDLKITDLKNHENISLSEVIAYSSQKAISKIALQIEPEYWQRKLLQLGFGKPLVLGFPGERTARLKTHKFHKQETKAVLGYGYGMEVNGLQLANAYATLADKGIHKSPQLIKGQTQSTPQRVFSAEVSDAILSMLEKTTQIGTATKARTPLGRVGGKTGTVHITSAQGGYQANKYRALFVGVVPIDDPQYVVAIVLENPQSDLYTGGQVAAPVFSEIAQSLLNIKKTTDESIGLHASL